ncbi:MAG: gluconate 2-dehydrogenase subunit 3 family protein [Flavisolibacter sp.]
MDRRKSIKLMALGSIGTGVFMEACKHSDKKATIEKAVQGDPFVKINRMPEELDAYKQTIAGKFFTPHEIETIAVLGDIIIPRDAISGSATDAKVPDFIEFIVKDKPELQTPMRGGLLWLDLQSVKRFNKAFKDCSSKEQLQLVDDIAYPENAKQGMKQGVSFFNLVRNLTATGFYTSEIGVKDIGYMGNRPTIWTGVPDDVLKQYGLAYSEKELRECI